MKRLCIASIMVLFFTSLSFSQSFRDIDKSPMDKSYFPDNFAHDREGGDKAIIRVTYSRPQKKDREVFGGIVSYNEVWRTGANEATEIKLFRDVKFGGKKLKAGSYSLFSIPGETAWIIIFNSDLDYWGAYSYKEENDVLRITVQPRENEEIIEAFSIQFEDKMGGSAVMYLAWDKTIVEVPFEY
jgi:hypothetical protein